MNHGKLIDFGEATARAGLFIVYHPTAEANELQELITREAKDIIEDHCGFTVDTYPLQILQTVDAELDAPAVDALFWNPTISRFENTLQAARKFKNTDRDIAEELITEWDGILGLLHRDSE